MSYKTCIESLIENITPNENGPIEVDIILDAGAFNGIYLYGSLLYMSELEKKGIIKIHRVSGASIGAICGAFFLLGKLDEIEELYKTMRDKIREETYFQGFYDILKTRFKSLPKNEFKKLNGRLFLNYHCTKEKKPIIISEYTSNFDIIDKLYRTSFLPFLINGDLTTEGYIDGMNPHIFKDRKRKIIYLNLISIDRIKSILNTKHEKNASSRAMTGIMQTHDFFLTKKPNVLCSWVNEWTLKDFGIYRMREVLCLIGVYMMSWLIILSKKVPNLITEGHFLKLFMNIAHKFYSDCLVYFMFEF